MTKIRELLVEASIAFRLDPNYSYQMLKHAATLSPEEESDDN